MNNSLIVLRDENIEVERGSVALPRAQHHKYPSQAEDGRLQARGEYSRLAYLGRYYEEIEVGKKIGGELQLICRGGT